MDVNTITALLQAIKDVGFPIVMCLYFIWDKSKTQKEFKAVLDNTYAVLTAMSAKLDGVVEDVDELADKSTKNVVQLPLPPPPLTPLPSKEGAGK